MPLRLLQKERMKTTSTSNLSPQSRWLLLYLKQRHDCGLSDDTLRKPLGVAAVAPLPVPYTYTIQFGRVGMNQMRGLIRRGWAEERSSGVYYLTDAGVEAASGLPHNQDQP